MNSAKILRCDESLFGCGAVLRAHDVPALMRKAEQHSRDCHGFLSMPPELVAEVEAHIVDDDDGGLISPPASPSDPTSPR
jgi:predicted small metal-binding protein